MHPILLSVRRALRRRRLRRDRRRAAPVSPVMLQPLEPRLMLSSTLAGSVWRDVNKDGLHDVGEPGFQAAVVELFNPGGDMMIGGGDDTSLGTTLTDANGNYTFNAIAATNYYLLFHPVVGYDFTLEDVGGDDMLDSDPDAGGYTAVFALADGVTIDTYDAGLVATYEWEAEGPAPTLYGGVDGMSAQSSPVAGAVHVVLPHPTDPDILWIGAVNGGVWRTDNATDSSPTWAPQTDFQESLSIGALVFDVADATHNTLVAGFGRWSSFGLEGGPRAGLIRTTDGGTTWTPIGGSDLDGINVSGLAVNGSTIVVSSNRVDGGNLADLGVFRSTDGGASFTQISGASGTGLPQGQTFDLTADPNDPATMYTTMFNSTALSTGGVYKSTDGGATWSRVSNSTMNALFADPDVENTEVTVGMNNNVYVTVLPGGQLEGLFRSGDSGSTWTELDLPGTGEGTKHTITAASNASPIEITSNGHGLSTGDRVVISGAAGNTAANGVWTITKVNPNRFTLNGSAGNGAYTGGGTWQGFVGINPEEDEGDPGGQGIIHTSIAADPTNDFVVYIGGDTQYDPFPNSLGASNYTGRLFRVDASLASGSQAVSLTHTGTTLNNSAPHADSRELAVDANGNLLESDDGGVFRRISPLTTGDWFSVNGNLQVAEFHSATYDALTDTIFAGAQDNGTAEQTDPDSTVWQEYSGGDGGIVKVDNISLAGVNESIRYSSYQYFGGFQRRVVNANGSTVSIQYPTLLIPGGDLLSNDSPQFYQPYELNAVDPTRGVTGTTKLYETFNRFDNLTALNNFGATVLSMAYGGYLSGVANEDVLWAGTTSNVYVRTSGTGNLSNLAAYPGSGAVDIVLNDDDYRNAFVIDDDQVFTTANTGAAWSDITGNLDDYSPGYLRTIEFIEGAVTDMIVVGCDGGVFVTTTDNLGVWTRLGSDLPRAPVSDLTYSVADDVLLAGTLGRGAWTYTSVIKPPKGKISGSKFEDLNGNGVRDQTVSNFVSTDIPKSILDMSTAASTITVTGLTSSVADINITFNITHTFDGDLDLALTSPDGTRIILFSSVGFDGQNFNNTTLDDEASTPITAGSAPFAGSYKPSGLLSTFDGETANGTWTLEVIDNYNIDQGTLNSWSIQITTEEPGLPGWTIYIDADDSGTLDGGETSTTTDANGDYSFAALAAGAYIIREVQQAGWTQTTPADSNVVMLDENEKVSDVDFGNFELAVIGGRKFNDLDGDGTDNSGTDPSLSGWTIQLLDTMDTVLDSTTTAGDGMYSFEVEPGVYRVREVQQAGWSRTTTNPSDITVTTSGSTFTGVDFGNTNGTSISGRKFNDLDGDGSDDGGTDPGISGWTIQLLDTMDMVLDTTTTASDGTYSFTALSDGTYRIREVAQAGWTQTTTDPADVMVSAGSGATGVDFGNFELVTVAGRKYEDADGDGTDDGGADAGLSGWTIELYDDSDTFITSTTTAGDGTYSFASLGPGAYRVREVQQTGWTQTSTDPTDITASSGTDVNGVDFGNFELITIAGRKYDDTDGDGTDDGGADTGLSGWTIELYDDSDAFITSATTTGDGAYSFGDLGPGVYRLREVAQATWTQTSTDPADITASSGTDVSGVDFGNFELLTTSDSYDVDEDGGVDASSVLTNDATPMVASLAAALVADVTHGTLTLNSDGTFSYTPDGDYNGDDTFTYRSTVGTDMSAVTTVTITVNSINDAPVTTGDSYMVDEDNTLNGASVLSNDSDLHGGAPSEDNTPLTATLVADVTHGTLTLNDDGTFTYEPDADYNGPDSFTYRAVDSLDGQSIETTVDITVNPVNDTPVAMDDSYMVDEDGTLNGATVLVSDTDVDGDSLTASLVTDVAHGVLTLNSDGTFTYTPDADYNGDDAFTYAANDGELDSNTATVTITVASINDAPVTTGDSYMVDEDGTLNGASVLSNDSDLHGGAPSEDNTPLTATLVADVTHGTLTLNDDGTFTYEPDADYNGPDSFTYRAVDSLDGQSIETTVDITVNPVNDTPVAMDDSYMVDEDGTLNGATVLVSDTDVDGDSLTASLVTDVAHGVLTLNSDGTFTYTPDADYNGDDTFTYAANDGELDSNTATVTITVASINDAPVTTGDSYMVDEDNTLNGASVLSNDSDLHGGAPSEDNTPLTATLVADVTHGTLTLNDDGTFTYEPDGDYNGPDGFTYRAVDSLDGVSTVTTVDITVNPVNDVPVTTGDSYTVDEDGTLNGATVLVNDTDVDVDGLTASLVTDVAHGVLTLNSDGTFTYTPDADYNGDDTFTYAANDGELDSNTATVTITVASINDAPVTTGDSYMVDEDNTLNGASVLSNDSDLHGGAPSEDNTPLTATLVADVTHGTLTLNDDGTFTYEPDADYNGPDGFTYRAVDSLDGVSTVTTVDITVNPVNDVPVTTGDSYTVDEDGTLNGASVLSNDSDLHGGSPGEDNTPLTATLVTDVSHGTLTLNSDGTFTYDPDANYNGADSFTYSAVDSLSGVSIETTVSITVNPVNDPPVASGDAYVTRLDVPIHADAAMGVLANDADVVEGDPITASLVTGPEHGALTLNADGSFDYTPDIGFFGFDSFTYVANDGSDDSSPATAAISVFGTLDVDDDGTVRPLTDGILIIRYLAGFTGETLINGALGFGAARTDPTAIMDVLAASVGGFLDADGDGITRPLTDGILIIRYLAGFTGATLASGAIGTGATRTTGEQVASYLDTFQPVSPPPPLLPEPLVTTEKAPPTPPADAVEIAAPIAPTSEPADPSVDLLARAHALTVLGNMASPSVDQPWLSLATEHAPVPLGAGVKWGDASLRRNLADLIDVRIV